MRYVLVGLFALALIMPVSAQEPAPQPRQVTSSTSTVTVVPMEPERPGLLSRIFNRNRNVEYPIQMTTPMQGGTITLEPVYDSRGQISAWRQIQVPGTAPTTTTVTGTATTTTRTTTMTLEPTYDRRGRQTGWRQVAMPTTPSTTINTAPMPRTTTNSVTQTGNVVNPTPGQATGQVTTLPNGQVVQAGYLEPMPEQPRRGILSRIFRR